MKIGMIGNRGHPGYVFDGLKLRPDVDLIAISSGSKEDDIGRLSNVCQQEGHSPRLIENYQDLLEIPGLSAVCIIGPFEMHAEMCLEAFQRGLHVFCEKPVAINLDQLKQLKNGYEKQSGLHFAAMMGLRYEPAFYTAWKLVRTGVVGEIRLLHAQKSYKLGSRPDYYTRRETYGGTIPWVGSHAIDWIYWFSQKPFLEVWANHSSLNNQGFGSLEVSALCQFRLEGEVFATASIDYLRPESALTHGDDRLRVAGDRGVLEVRQGEVFLINEQDEKEQKPEVMCERQIFCDFLNQVEGTDMALIGSKDVFDVTEACLLARQSADLGRSISFSSSF